MKRITKKQFCSMNSEAKKIRYSDPIQFEILYNEWKRSKQGFI